MKKVNLFLSALTLCGLISFTGCNNTNTSSSTSSVSSSIAPAETVEYKFTVKSISGDRVGDATIEIYNNNRYVAEVMTDLIGNASIKLQKAKYTIRITDLPKGLSSEEEYEIKEGQNLIEVKAQVIDEDMPSNHKYKLGDVMYDFSFYDMENNEVVLSEVLQEKKGVLLNFWATWCGPCLMEVPHFVDAYAKYKNDFEIIALVADSKSDSPDSKVREILLDYEVEFPVGRDENYEMYLSFSKFHGNSIPCSVVIDQYGIINGVKVGSYASYNDLADTIEAVIEKYE